MPQFIVRALLSGILIACIALVAKRQPTIGALIASLPLISILAVIWLWSDTRNNLLIASHLEATFWLVLPSMPMFLIIPKLLRNGFSFWAALGIGIIITAVLYLSGIEIAKQLKF